MIIKPDYPFDEEWVLTQRVTMNPKEYDFWFSKTFSISNDLFINNGYIEVVPEDDYTDDCLEYDGKLYAAIKLNTVNHMTAIYTYDRLHCVVLKAGLEDFMKETRRLWLSKTTVVLPWFE